MVRHSTDECCLGVAVVYDRARITTAVASDFSQACGTCALCDLLKSPRSALCC
jgi:hypothetical protein